MKMTIGIIAALLLSGCAELPKQQCTATAFIGNQNESVPVFGVETVANQTKYYAGGSFGFRWVSKNNFTSSTCSK